jgi:phage terminase large subunit
MPTIKIPYSPRPLQLDAHDAGKRFTLLVCHRRFGKTVYSINQLIRAAVTCKLTNPRFAYLAPLYRQAKAVAWDMLKLYSRPIPGMQYNEAELRADFPNGARISLHGTDASDNLRGLGFDGVVLDEYGQMPSRLWPEIIRPALADREGWSIFIGTPKGFNSFYDLYESIKDDPDWYVRIHRASETGYVPQKELDAARKQMSDETYNQEFECSWHAAIQGSYYGRLLDEAMREQRVGKVNHDPALLVETWADLGIADATALWFAQRNGPEIRLIDYYEASGEALGHYAKVMEDKAKAGGWKYGDHVFPHDVRVRSLDTGRTRIEALQSLGIEPSIVPNHRIEDGIESVRRMLKNCWFDELRCKHGLDALRQYRAQYDDARRTFRLKPYHDWASHAADSFRYGCMHAPAQHHWEPLQYDNTGIV